MVNGTDGKLRDFEHGLKVMQTWFAQFETYPFKLRIVQSRGMLYFNHCSVKKGLGFKVPPKPYKKNHMFFLFEDPCFDPLRSC